MHTVAKLARLLLADDHAAMLGKIVRLLESEFEIAGTVGNGLDLVEAASRLDPDVVVLDITMPGLDGIQAARRLQRIACRAKLVFLTVHEDPDYVREETLARQIAQGVVPAGTKLTARPKEIPAWDSLTADQKRLYAHMMEIYAACLAYCDFNIGRVIQAVEETGELDNTLIIYIQGDNGASGEGAMQGLANEVGVAGNGVMESEEYLLSIMDDLGGPLTYNHYPVGWAHAMCSPFQWTKQVASHFGGTRNGLVISWPKGIKQAGEIRSQFCSVIDITPTILEAAGVKPPAMIKRFETRGVLHTWAMPDGTQKIEKTGPLGKKRMETIDEEITKATLDYLEKAKKADKPFFLWWNATCMHVHTHLKQESQGKTGLGIYPDGMVEHDGMVGEILDKLKELGLDENTIVMYSTDNGAEKASWPDGGTTPFRGEKNSNWEGGYRVPCAIRWPGVIKPSTIHNDIFAHEDMLPTLLAAAGVPDVKEQLLKGMKVGDKTFKVHLDGYNMTDALAGKSPSPRREFPPSQKVGSFSLDDVMEKLTKGVGDK